MYILAEIFIYLSYIKTILSRKNIMRYGKIMTMMIENENNKTGFYKDLEENFNKALMLADSDFSHVELIEMLKNGNIPEKQISALKLDGINNLDEAEVLLCNLTGCDGKIREAVALKIFQIVQRNEAVKKFFTENSSKIFADATIDINANICRLVVDSVKSLKDNKHFSKEYTNFIMQFAKEALVELDKFIFRDKKYVINKQIFKLYWCLETLKNFYEFANIEELNKILTKCAEQKEYTIREKVAELSVLSDNFGHLRQQLKTDENYYVRSVFL